MSQETLSKQLALRIGIAARSMPDTDTKRLMYVLTHGNTQEISEKSIAGLKLKQFKSACDGEFSSMDDNELKQAIAILKGKEALSNTQLPAVTPYQQGEMPGSIRIACASNDAIKVDGHFGSCSLFLIYQLSSTEARLIDIRSTKLPADANNQSIDKNDFRAESIKDCQLLYIASVGGPAAAKIVKKGIHPIKLPNMESINDVINQLQQVINTTPPPWLAKVMGHSAEQRIRFEQEELE